MFASRVVCSVSVTTSWLERLDLEPVEVGEHVGALDARRPHHELGGYEIPVLQLDALVGDLDHARAGLDVHVQVAKGFGHALRDALGQCGNDAVRGLDERDLDVLLRVDLVETVGHEPARRLMQLGGKLSPGRARADDRHIQLPRAHGAFLRERTHAGVDQAAVEPLGLFGRVQHDRVLFDARRIESVADTADGDDEGVVLEGAHRRDLAAFLVVGGGEVHELLRAVDAGHLAVAELESVPITLRLIGKLVATNVHAAGGDLMQERLPDVRARLLDEGNLRLAPLAELVAQPRRQLEAARATAHDDDVMQAAACVHRHHLHGDRIHLVHRRVPFP